MGGLIKLTLAFTAAVASDSSSLEELELDSEDKDMRLFLLLLRFLLGCPFLSSLALPGTPAAILGICADRGIGESDMRSFDNGERS